MLRYGSLPVTLEPQTVQTVSPTLGEDSLKAGLAAGLLGLALVCLYMLFYYRALGLVVVLGLVRVGGAALLDHLLPRRGAEPGRRHRHRRVGRRHRRQLRRVLRAAQGRGEGRPHAAQLHRAGVLARLPHDPRRRHLELHRRHRALPAHGRPGARLRLLPRASPRSSTWSSPGSSPDRWWASSPRTAFFTEAPRFGVARGLAAPRPVARRPAGADDDRPDRAGGRAAVDLHPPVPRRDAHPSSSRTSSAGRSSAASSSSSACCRCGSAASTSASTSRAAIVWEVPAGDVSVAEAQDALADNGLDGLTVQTLTAGDDVLPAGRGRAARRRREGPGRHARSWPSSPAPTSRT